MGNKQNKLVSKDAAQSEHLGSLPPRNGDVVRTPYGKGVVECYREADAMYVVVLTEWQVADNGNVRVYLKAHSLLHEAAAPAVKTKVAHPIERDEDRFTTFPNGTAVDSQFGPGVVVNYRRPTGVYEVVLGWTMAQNTHPTAFLQADMLSRHVKVKKGQIVSTVFGTGVCGGVRARDGMHMIMIKQSQGQATAFVHPRTILAVDLKAFAGAIVNTPYGVGKVLSYRPFDAIYVVGLPYGTCFLNARTITGMLTPSQAKKYMKKKGDCVVM
jgi:hypothetical protein